MWPLGDVLMFRIWFAEPSHWNQFHPQPVDAEHRWEPGIPTLYPSFLAQIDSWLAPDRSQRSSHHVGSADSQQVQLSFEFLVSSAQEITGNAKICCDTLAKGEGNQ